MTIVSCAKLATMGRHVPSSFELSIGAGAEHSTVEVESILRIVPGRRLVALARWKNTSVIIKLFFDPKHWKRNLERDVSGIDLLRQSNIPTPGVLLQTKSADSKGGVLLIEYLQQGKGLGALLEEAGDQAAKNDAIDLVVKAIAGCHQLGLWQRDIHLDNFMLSDGAVYVLDGGEIKGQPGRVNSTIRRENLALFCAQFPVSYDSKVPQLLSKYQQYSVDMDELDLTELEREIKQARRQRLARFERKLFRSTTANRRERNSNKFYVYDRAIHSADLERFIKRPDSFIKQDKLLKQGNSSTVALVEIDGQEFVLKRYNIKSIWHGLSRAFRPSRAHHSWRNASVLEMLGVKTAHPYLFLEERRCWIFRRRAYFLCAHIPAQDMGTKWQALSASSEADEKSNLAANAEMLGLFSSLLSIMNDYRISHGDMKATNFIVDDEKLYVLDLDAMRRHDSDKKFRAKFAIDLKRFRKNWIGSPLETSADSMIKEIQLLQAG